MFSYLRKSLILFIINRHIDSSRTGGSGVSLYNARLVGLMAVIDSKERLERIINLKKSIESNGPKVVCISYVPFRKVPDYFNTQMQVSVFSKKDVNLLGIPRGRNVKEFLERNYDILVDLSYDDCLPLMYLSGVTKAKLKAGKYRDDMVNVYDFMIRENETRAYGDFIFSIKNYLSKINTVET